MTNPAMSTDRPWPRDVQHQAELQETDSRPSEAAWITDELIAEHQRVWSRRYGREISEAEAIEIIMNIKHFAEVVLKSMEHEGQT